MSPSTALQSRIRHFEAMGASQTVPNQSPKGTESGFLPMDEPISPTASSISTMKPALPYIPRKSTNRSDSPSPPNLGCKTSLIDLDDWVMEAHSPSTGNLLASPGTRSKSFPKMAPPLPPRTPSSSSIKSTPPIPVKNPVHPFSPATLKPSRSDSLTVDHTYPPNFIGNGRGLGHVHASSTSSFQSVSLSSDGGIDIPSIVAHPHEDLDDIDKESVDDSFSFETVSTTTFSSPSFSSIHDWEKDIAVNQVKNDPPSLPERSKPRSPALPPSVPSVSPPSVILQSLQKRAPPPIPPRPPSNRTSLASTSDRSSILSTNTVATSHTGLSTHAKHSRPTPIPIVARKRYEQLFTTNVKAAQLCRPVSDTLSPADFRGPQSARRGWRGLSVDLITNPEPQHISAIDQELLEGQLDGFTVKKIWVLSKLDRRTLRDIWNECAVPGESNLDREGFIKGMWRIDEELRRIQSRRDAKSRARPSPSLPKPLLSSYS